MLEFTMYCLLLFRLLFILSKHLEYVASKMQILRKSNHLLKDFYPLTCHLHKRTETKKVTILQVHYQIITDSELPNS